jgi:hypothetical protein
MAFATRLPYIADKSQNLRRTNVLTLIQKAAKLFGRPNLLHDYDVLCDAVHPNFGGSECFWTEVGLADDISQVRVLLEKYAPGKWTQNEQELRPGSALAMAIARTSIWALERLLADLTVFRLVLTRRSGPL